MTNKIIYISIFIILVISVFGYNMYLDNFCTEPQIIKNIRFSPALISKIKFSIDEIDSKNNSSFSIVSRQLIDNYNELTDSGTPEIILVWDSVQAFNTKKELEQSPVINPDNDIDLNGINTLKIYENNTAIINDRLLIRFVFDGVWHYRYLMIILNEGYLTDDIDDVNPYDTVDQSTMIRLRSPFDFMHYYLGCKLKGRINTIWARNALSRIYGVNSTHINDERLIDDYVNGNLGIESMPQYSSIEEFEKSIGKK